MDGLKKKDIFSAQDWHCLPVTNFIVLLSSFWGRFSSFEFLLLIHLKGPNLVMQLLKPIK